MSCDRCPRRVRITARFVPTPSASALALCPRCWSAELRTEEVEGIRRTLFGSRPPVRTIGVRSKPLTVYRISLNCAQVERLTQHVVRIDEQREQRQSSTL